jgi:putative Holliday junction resolvase
VPDPSRAPASGSILAIDLGLARTGLARSDAERRVAFGLPTFHARGGASLRGHLLRLHQEEPIAGVVLGLPLHMDGRPGDLAGRVRRLAAWIRETLGVPTALLDERLTTFEAEQMLAEAGTRARRRSGERDRLAAQILLREFLAAGCPFPADGGGEPEEADSG